VRNRGIITSAYLALRAKAGISPSFAYEFLNAWDISKAIYGYGSGLRQNLDFVHFKRMPVALPPISEQTAIVRFLDYYDRRIGRYIRAKQRMIKLLEEQKQAIIHEYVNGKINPFTGKPYPRYKPSGVEWLGDFPEHWEMRRNGMLFTQRNEVGFGNLPILEVSLRTGTRIREFENSHRKQVLTDREKYKRAAAGDIAYNMMRMWQGAVGVAPIDGLISPAYVVAKPLPGTASRYFSHLFRTPAYMNEIDKYSRGIVKDRNRLYWEDFKRIRSCYPPFEEQLAIADTVVQMTEKIGAAAYRVHHQISLFREFRTRLVADVVTGKVDVREAAARLPEEGAETEPIEESDALSEMDEDAADQLDDKCEETETV
jgi:type I restriction enzyme S subunit